MPTTHLFFNEEQELRTEEMNTLGGTTQEDLCLNPHSESFVHHPGQKLDSVMRGWDSTGSCETNLSRQQHNPCSLVQFFHPCKP